MNVDEADPCIGARAVLPPMAWIFPDLDRRFHRLDSDLLSDPFRQFARPISDDNVCAGAFERGHDL
jgi:hypothetical protein